MPTLTIRNMSESDHDALRRRAAAHRRSMEAEARAMLTAGLRSEPTPDERAAALARLRGMKPIHPRVTPEGWSDVDEFLAEKHLEAAWEAEQVSSDERMAWLERLARFEAWPQDVEAFVAGRIGRS